MILEPFLPAASVSIRLLPLLVVAPVASFRRAPLLVRIILSVALAIVLSSSLNPITPAPQGGELILLMLSEFAIGASLAFGFHAASAALHTMGQLVDMQIGFAAASLFDPNTESIATPTAELLTIGLLVTLIQFNVHHDLLIGFSKLLNIIPPGTVPNWSEDWLKIIGTLYVLGLVIVSPIIMSLWFTDLVLAFISRALPQTPMYFVGLPVKVAVGILMLAWFFTQALEPFLRIWSNSLLSWNMMFKV